MKGAVFEAVAERYADRIYAIALNYFKSPYDADDIVQEVLLKLYRSDTAFESEAHLKHWLLRVAVNQCKKISLSAWRRRNISLEGYLAGLQTEPGAEYANDAAQAAEEAERRNEILRAILKLPKKYRLIIHLYYYEDYDTKEIAGILRMNEATVRTRLARSQNFEGGLFGCMTQSKTNKTDAENKVCTARRLRGCMPPKA